MRERDVYQPTRRKARRFDDDDSRDGSSYSDSANFEKRGQRRPSALEVSGDGYDPDRPPAGDRWSTWDQSEAGERGPQPYPDWLVTELAAVDTELGVLKTGKEADVHLLERGVPGTDRSCLLAAKRYRTGEHRMFHRDAGYLEGRRERKSRARRAVANRTAFGRELIAAQWAGAEFSTLCQLTALGVAVPYPVQILGTEILMEFIGEPDGTAAPRLAQLRPDPATLADLWRQLVDALVTLARAGLAHGDLSPYNILVRDDQLFLIDLPQIVDVVVNPQGPTFMDRDATVVADWFTARGLPDTGTVSPTNLAATLRDEAGLR